MTYSTRSELIARVLAGSWHASPSPLELSIEELEVVLSTLLETGAGGLAWWRARFSSVQDSNSASELQQAYRLYTLQAARHERDLGQIFALLHENNVEAILVKGWAVARLYPKPGLRPYGDIDLCVRPNDYRRADTLLNSRESNHYNVDLHRGFALLDHHSWEELYSRSVEQNLEDNCVRLLCAEDHLRVLCFHFLREGAWRPLWLCDIAVALESRPADFDWNLFLGSNRKRAGWFVCTILLAHKLLQASFEEVPPAITAKSLPRWFVGAVLKAWQVRSMQRRHLTPMTTAWRTPAYALKGLPDHWPNPIEGTIGVRGPFNELPRLPFQIGNCLGRTADFFLQQAKRTRAAKS